jgi:hypothetical protein
MKKYGEYLSESLAAEIKTEPKTAAAKEARKLGLTYMGFGRYADRKGQVAYVVDGDKLVPYKSRDDIDTMHYKASTGLATKSKKIPAKTKDGKLVPDKNELLKKEAGFYNTVMNKRQKEDKKIIKQKDKEAQALSDELYKFYSPNMFDKNEINAINEYTSEAFEDINRYLYKGHDEGVTNDDDKYLNHLITSLDSAFEDTQAPFPYTVYTGLSSRYKPEKIVAGSEYIFRGYLSTSLSHSTAIDSFADADFSDKPVVLQIEIAKGQKSIYVDPVSTHQGEGETLLPRGSRVKIISGPHIIDSSVVSENESGSQVHLFHCKLVKK